MVELQALPGMNEVVVAVEEAPEGGCGAGAVGHPVHTGAEMLPSCDTPSVTLSGATSRMTEAPRRPDPLPGARKGSQHEAARGRRGLDGEFTLSVEDRSGGSVRPRGSVPVEPWPARRGFPGSDGPDDRTRLVVDGRGGIDPMPSVGREGSRSKSTGRSRRRLGERPEIRLVTADDVTATAALGTTTRGSWWSARSRHGRGGSKPERGGRRGERTWRQGERPGERETT